MKYIVIIMIGAALMMAGCSSGGDSAPANNVTISGTFTYGGWTMGLIHLVAFPQGTNPGPTGEIGETAAAGTAATTPYSITVSENSGSVYVFGFNDADGSFSPDGTEGGDCSTAFPVADTAVTGINLTFVATGGAPPGWCLVSP